MNKRRRHKAKRRRLQAKWLRDEARALRLPRGWKLRPLTDEFLKALASFDLCGYSIKQDLT